MNARILRVLWGLGGGLSMALLVVLSSPKERRELRRVSIPDGGICPDLSIDRDALEIVYSRDGETYFASSRNEGKSFSPAKRLSTPLSSAVIGHERGPKVAAAGAIHVVWMGPRGAPLSVFYVRSTDGGQTFSEPVDLTKGSSGVDGVSVAADAEGHVYVVWLDGGRGPDGPTSSNILFRDSNDNGETFAPVQALRSNYPGGACSCCQMKALTGPDRKLLVGFRGAHRNIRDIVLLGGSVGSAPLGATPVSNDHWQLDACPMAGPFLQRTVGELLVSWTSDGEVYRALSRDDGQTFGPRTSPAEPRRSPRRDAIGLTDGSGETLFAWVEGSHLHWERISSHGRVHEWGENPDLPVNSKPAAFVNRDGGFSVVY